VRERGREREEIDGEERIEGGEITGGGVESLSPREWVGHMAITPRFAGQHRVISM
jgi:hypothetical protein